MKRIKMNNTIEDIFNRFLDFEEEHKLFEKEIRGFTFWSHIRFDVYKTILIQTGLGSENANNQLSTVKKISTKNLWLGIVKSPLFILKKKKYLIVNSVRRNLERGKYKCIYTDFLTDVFDGETQSIEMRNSSAYQTPAYSENIKYTDGFELLAGVYLRLLQKTTKITESEIKDLKKICDNIPLEFGINSSYLLNRFFDAYLFYKSRKPFYNLILNRGKPRKLFLMSSYTHLNHLLIYLAQKKGIEVVELQHGTMGKMHIGYNTKYKKHVMGMPDKMLLFGEFWKNNISLPIPKQNLIVGGFNQLNQDLEKYSTISRKEKDGTKTILILSQWTISKEIIDFSIDLADKLSSKDYQIKLRFHPSEYKDWQKNFPQLIKTKVIVNDNPKIGLYENFSEADIVVGCYSTALYEAIAFKKRTFILAVKGFENYISDLYENNFAIKIESPKELVDALEKEARTTTTSTKEMWLPKGEFNYKYFE